MAELTRFPLIMGLDTFGDVTNDAEGRPLSHAQTIRNLVEEGVLADQLGCLLYTSPSPRDLSTSRMPSSA